MMSNPIIYIVMESLENGKSCMHHSNYFTLDEAVEFVKNNKAKFGDSYFILDSNGVEIPVPKDLWAECVAMADKKEHKIEYFEGVYRLKYLVERRGSNSVREYYFENSNVKIKSNSPKKVQFTLPELHAKLTELTKG